MGKISIHAFCIVFFLFAIIAFSQQILDEMELVDISGDADIKSSIIRDPKQALLIVKSQIPNLTFQSNNVIHKVVEVEPGRWNLYLAPGTHRIVFQAQGFISEKKRFFFSAKDVKGTLIRILPAESVQISKDNGILIIKSEPDGAGVFLNDEFYGSTPYAGRILTGSYRLELRKEKYRVHSQSVIIRPGETNPLNVQLSPEIGILKVITSPENADVYLNNKLYGRTPLLAEVPTGSFNMEIKNKLYKTVTDNITISLNDTLSMNRTLPRNYNVINVISNPMQAEVVVDNDTLGKTPLTYVKIPAGNHSIFIQRPGYQTYKTVFDLPVNGPGKIFNVPLRLKETLFSVQGSPQQVRVRLDDKSVGTMPFDPIDVTYGKHRVTIDKTGYHKLNTEIEIKSEEPFTYQYRLRPKSKRKTLLMSTILPGSGQIYAGQKLKGYLWNIGTLGSVAIAVLSYSNFKNAKDQYLNDQSGYLENTNLSNMTNLRNTMLSSYNKMENSYNTYRLMTIVASSLWVLNVVDAVLFFPHIERVPVRIGAGDQNVTIMLSVDF